MRNGRVSWFSEARYITKGVLLALMISLLVCVFLAAALFFTPLSERVVPYGVYISSLFSIVIGSAYASRRIQVRGWLNGGLTGLAYILLILVLAGLFELDMDIGLHLLTRLFLAFALGSMGGILGLNL